MPMDIRMFFAKKGDTTKTQTSNNKPSNQKQPDSDNNEPAAKARKKTQVAPNEDNSDTNDDIKIKPGRSCSSKKTKLVIRDSDDDDDDDESPTKKRKVEPTAAAAATAAATTTKAVAKKKVVASQQKAPRKEISAASFFAAVDQKKKTTAAPPVRSSTRNTQRRNYQELDDEVVEMMDGDDDTDNGNESPPVAATKKEKAVVSKPSSTATMKTEPPSNKSQNKRPADDDDDDDGEAFVEPAAASTPSSSTKRSTNNNKAPKDSTASPACAKKARKSPLQSAKKPPRAPPLKPSLTRDSFDTNNAISECMAGYTFVFSGVLSDLSRDDAQDLVKSLGGRVTTAVSSKTDYLVVGPVLEDGRDYQQGKKYIKAVTQPDQTFIVMGEKALYGLAQQYDDQARSRCKAPPAAAASEPAAAAAAKPAAASAKPAAAAVASAKPASASKPVNNPYARAAAAAPITSNPYAKVNPYAKKPAAVATSNRTTGSASTVPDSKPAAVPLHPPDTTNNMLWVDKYKPQSSSEILGNQESVRKLKQWLNVWEHTFNNSKAVGKSFSAPNGPWRAALLSGPPGIGKTTTAILVAKEAGRDVIEFNASDVRSKKAMQNEMGDITGSHTIQFQVGGGTKATTTTPRIRRCVIMDEVDGMGAGDRSGMTELIQMIKNSRVPIICICNDRQSQKIKSLLPYCMDLRYRRPVKSVIASRALAVAEQEGMLVERNAAEAIAESCGNDVRQVLNCLQMWASDKVGKDGSLSSNSTMTYRSLKDRERSINKDEILRVSLFDAAKVILEGRRGLGSADPETERSHFFRRNDAFFVDYNFIGLLVQQNYLKVVQGQYNEAKRSSNQSTSVLHALEQMHAAADTMSDYAHAENALRGDQNWSLLPFTGMLTVKTGYHAGGETGGFLAGFPEFTAWLGKNSTKGKNTRLLNELKHHMNFHVSGGTRELRMSYLPVFRERFLSLLSSGDDQGVEEAIHLMDEYGMSREDVFEKLDEFKIDKKAAAFGDLDSKHKAAFTRTYNQMAHKSQALVAEQGGGGKKTRGKGAAGESAELDAIDDDKVDEEEEDDEEEDVEKIKALFKKKGRKKAATGNKKVNGKKKR